MRARIDAAHLPGADADRGAVLGIDDGVRLDVLADREGEQQVGAAPASVGARLVTTLRSFAPTRPLSRLCTRKPPATRLARSAAGARDRAGRRSAAGAGSSSSASSLRAPSSASGAMMTSAKILAISARGRGVERAVERDDAAEGADRDRRRAPCDRPRRRSAPMATPQGLACLMMATAGGRSNSATQFEGRVGVVEVVVAELLALELRARWRRRAGRCRRGRRRRAGAGSRHSAASARERGRRSPAAGKRLAELAGEPARDRGVVGGGARIGLGGEPLAQRRAGGAAVLASSRRSRPRSRRGR